VLVEAGRSLNTAGLRRNRNCLNFLAEEGVDVGVIRTVGRVIGLLLGLE